MTAEPIEPKSWARATLWLVAASVLRNVGLLSILLALGQLTDPQTVGRYALALALTTPTFVFAQLGLKGVYLTLRGVHRFSSFLFVQSIALGLAILASMLIALVANPAITSTVFLVCLVKAIECFAELGAGSLQRFGRTEVVFLAYLPSALLGLAVVVGMLLLTQNLDLALAGLAVVNAVVTASTILRLGVRLAHRFEVNAPPAPSGELRRILAAGLPTGFALAVLSLMSTMPQYFLAATWGDSVVGHFAVLLYLVAIADIFGGTLTQAWIPSARRRLEWREDGFATFVLGAALRWTLIFIPLTAAGLWAGSVFLPVVMSPDYVITADLMVPIGIAILMIPVLNFSGTAISVLNLYVHNITMSLATSAASLVACALLVPTFGLVGALWAIVAAYAARTTVTLLVLVTRTSRGMRTAPLRR